MMRFAIAVSCGLLCALFLAACGGGTHGAGSVTRTRAIEGASPGRTGSTPLTTPERPAPVAAASCPRMPPTGSSPLVNGQLAPGQPVWTTLCTYRPSRRGGRASHATVLASRTVRGGPLDRVLNTTPPADTACATVATSPAVVLLRYSSGSVRHVVVQSGGCSVVMSDGSERLVSQTTLTLMQRLLLGGR